jgi:cell division septation protein DedD
VAATNPVQIAPQATPSGNTESGGYLVQVSSQRNEADAQASYRALQGKFPSVLGSRSPVIKRADLGDKGVYYRAMVGPFGSPDEASRFCGSLKTAGGQCVVQRN